MRPWYSKMGRSNLAEDASWWKGLCERDSKDNNFQKMLNNSHTNPNDAHDTIDYSDMALAGINETVVRQISASNKEPAWMLDLRLEALAVFQSKQLPTWGPDLSRLDLDSIYYFAKPEGAGDKKSWDDVPENIKKTFDRLGIPEAEKSVLAGVGAQYDSEVVYHNLRDDLRAQGVIFEDMSVAIRNHEELVRKHFMRAVPIADHTFSALHAAVWSGGTFLYIPK